MQKYLLAFLMAFGTMGFAQTQYDYDFQQDRMLLTSDGIYIISSFEETDGISAYAYNGNLAWEQRFRAKIVSWQIAQNYIFVFSKHRSGYKTYLTCLDRFSGRVIWERP